MKLLALDTSQVTCSAALVNDEAISEKYREEARAHTRILIPMVKELLDEAALSIGELDAIVLGNGPGSFIGMRIGASVAQGLAHGAGLELVPVSSLAAVAAQCFAESAATRVAVAQDARMNEIYLGLYERSSADLPRALVPDAIVAVDAVELPGGEDEWMFAGAGWARYPGTIEARPPQGIAIYPRARYLLGPGQAALASGSAVSPESLQPTYLRQQVAVPPRRS